MQTIYADAKKEKREEPWKKAAREKFEQDRAVAFWHRAVPMMNAAARRGRIKRVEETSICLQS